MKSWRNHLISYMITGEPYTKAISDNANKGAVPMKKISLAIALLVIIPSLSFAEENLPQPIPEAASPTPAMINCQYQFPKGVESVESALLKAWAEKALVQSFQFVPENINTELKALQSCYTDQGWKAFKEALKTSGNLEAIRSQSLHVTSQINGEIHIENIKEKQWKVSMPLKVTYQNKDKQLLQALNVDLLIALKKSGALGIMQVIAVPQKGQEKKAA